MSGTDIANTVSIHDRIGGVPEADWNLLVGRDRLLARHGFLRAVERAQINDCRHFYVVAARDGAPIGHAASYAISTALDAFASGPVLRGTNAVRRLWPRFLMMRSVECGSPVALGTTLSVRSDMDAGEVLPLLVEAIEARAKEWRIPVLLFRDFTPGNLHTMDFLGERGYHHVHNLPGTELDIQWASFDEYLDSMRSRYRNKIRAQMRLFDQPEVTTEIVTDFSELAPELTRLWTAAYKHATEYRREVLSDRFFVAFDEELAERSAVLLFRVHGKPAAFSLLLFDDDTLIPLFCGLDYGLNSTYSLYFNLLYGAVRIAIEHQMDRIDFGITTLFPKMHLGCRVVPQVMYMKHTWPLLRRLVPKLFELSTPKGDVKEPKVFRT